MGSTGIGSFSDYTTRKTTSENGNNGGASGNDNCTIAFNSHLEEVGRCFYFLNYGNVPDIGTEVFVRFNGVRIAVENLLGEELGYLPTKYNYIRYCMKDNFSYAGEVNSSILLPTPSITVDITPQ